MKISKNTKTLILSVIMIACFVVAFATQSLAAQTGHSVLISGSSHDRIAIVNNDGSTIWELRGLSTLWTEVNDAEVFDNGDIVYAARNSFAPVGAFVRKITPNYITGSYTLVWEYAVPSGGENHTCQILDNGDVLICEAYSSYIRVIELDGQTGEVKKLIGNNGRPLECFNEEVGGSHNQLRQISKTADGTYLLAHFSKDITYEINENGETVKTYPFGKAFTAVKDKNGNVIISAGNQSTIKAFSPEGEEIWSVGTTEVEGVSIGFPAAVVPLDNGNILFANWGGYGGASGQSAVMEIDPVEKTLVWSMNTDDGGLISNVFLVKNIFGQDFTLAQSISSPVDVVANEATDKVFVADYTNKTVNVINANTYAPVATYNLPDSPNAMAVTADGSKLYVACGEQKGIVAIIDIESGMVRSTVSVGYTPSSLTFGEDESTLYVANRFDNSVSKLALTDDGFTATVVKEAKTTKEPMAIAYAKGSLYVAGHLPAMAATSTTVASAVCVADADTLATSKVLTLCNGSTDVKDMAVSPDGDFIYVTHTIGRYWVPTTQLDRGWVYTNALTEIDTALEKVTATMLVDDIDRGAGNPWGVAASEDKLVVSTAGTGEVIIIDRTALRERLDLLEAGSYTSADKSVSKISDVPNSLTFLTDLKKRVKLNASGTKGVAILDNNVYAANYYSGSVSIVGLKSGKKVKDIALSVDVEETDERAGERLWNDATLSYGMWQSCASCHPDARVDGLNWDNMNDGIGTVKQARSMIDTFKRGRVMATGIRANADVAISAGMKYIMFNAGMTEELELIGKYLKALEPMPSPELNRNGTLTESAKRGKELFEGKANCASCHIGEIFGQDKLVYNLYASNPAKEQRGLLIAPLREVWRTAPYFHDGSAATIEDVLQAKIDMGMTVALDEAEIADLASYVKSIGTEVESYTVTFDANGGITPVENIEVVNGEPYGTLPVPEKSGFTFKGWYTDENLGTLITSSTIVNLTDDQVLIAVWEKDEVEQGIEVTKSTETVEDVTYTYFDVTLNGFESGCTVLLAVYDGDKLVDVQSIEYEGEIIPFAVDVEYEEARVFVWQGFDSIQPIVNYKVVE